METESKAGAPLDMAHVARFTLGKRDLEREILGLFVAQMISLRDGFAAATSEADWKRLAHTLKGSAMAVGGWRLGALGAEAERGGLFQDCSRRADLIARIASEADDVIRFCRSW